MKTQQKANASISRKQICRRMGKKAPNQSGAKLGNGGFTLVELIMTIALIGILATLAVPAYHDLTYNAQNARARADIRTLDYAISAYFADQNKLPAQLNDIGPQANIKDPWNRPFQYFNIGTGTGSPGPQYIDYVPNTLNDDYDLYSLGPDGQTDHIAMGSLVKNLSSDDIVRTGSGSAIELGIEF